MDETALQHGLNEESQRNNGKAGIPYSDSLSGLLEVVRTLGKVFQKFLKCRV